MRKRLESCGLGFILVGLLALGFLFSGCPLGMVLTPDYVKVPAEYNLEKNPGPTAIVPLREEEMGYFRSNRGKRVADALRTELRKQIPSLNVIPAGKVEEVARKVNPDEENWPLLLETLPARYLLVGEVLEYRPRDLDAPHPLQSTLIVRVTLRDSNLGGDEVWSSRITSHFPPKKYLTGATATVGGMTWEEIESGLAKEVAVQIVNSLHDRRVYRWEKEGRLSVE